MLVTKDVPVIEHGVGRIERTLMEGIVEPDPDEAYPRETKTELFSYPISRIIVSLAETPAAVGKYARAGVNTLYEHMLADSDAGDDDVHSETRASLDDFLRGSNLDGVVRTKSNWNRNSRRVSDGYWVNVGPYLIYSNISRGVN